jgi:catalase
MLHVSSCYWYKGIGADKTGALWQKVFTDEVRQQWIETVSGHMENCKDKKIIQRQITIFKEVDQDLGERMEKATGVKALEGGVAAMQFNGEFTS